MNNRRWLAGILLGLLMCYLVAPVTPLIPLAVVFGKDVPPMLMPGLRAYFYPLTILSDTFPLYRRFLLIQTDFLQKLVE